MVKRAISKNDSKKKTKKRKRRGECWVEQIKGKKKIWDRDKTSYLTFCKSQAYKNRMSTDLSANHHVIT
jgi:hypothetical protein